VPRSVAVPAEMFVGAGMARLGQMLNASVRITPIRRTRTHQPLVGDGGGTAGTLRFFFPPQLHIYPPIT
jgi:hypothetical protein